MDTEDKANHPLPAQFTLVSVSVGGCFIYPMTENLFCHESGKMKITVFTHEQTVNFIRLHKGLEFTTKFVTD